MYEHWLYDRLHHCCIGSVFQFACPVLQGPHFSQLKPIIKAQISGKLVTSGISDVAIASVYFFKNHLKKLIMIIIIIITE